MENKIENNNQQVFQIKQNHHEKIADLMRLALLALSKMFDKLFKTNISSSAALNNPLGKRVKVQHRRQQKQPGGSSVKISRGSEAHEDKSTSKDRSSDDKLLTIKDVLRGEKGVDDLQKQQEKLAEQGHALFKQSGRGQEMSKSR